MDTTPIWIAAIAALVTGTLSPVLLLWMKNRYDRQVREAAEARADAREARTQAALDVIQKQTDGVISQVSALAEATGRMKGETEAAKTAQGTAATLALGQQQGRDAERESISTKVKLDSDQPLRVADDVVAASSKLIADATQSMADATERVADVAVAKEAKEAAAEKK